MSIEPRGIRGGTRIPVELPVHIRWKSPAGIDRFANGKTRSISGTGLLILAPVRLRSDTPISFEVSLPVEITRVPVRLQCKGRVIRQQGSGAPAGLGVVLDDYRIAVIKRPA
jgi:PilZ domain